MKKSTLESCLDQKKPGSHFLFILITILVVGLIRIGKDAEMSVREFIFLFLLGLIQLELFVFIARLIFKKLNISFTGKEFTRIVLSRFFLFIFICFIASIIIILLFKLIPAWLRGDNILMVAGNFFEYEFRAWFRSTLAGLSTGAVIFIFIQWQDALRREQKLREENLVFQNETLKSQVNPHFLFNSLNTVSSLIQSQPDKAELFISNLSSVYRYVLENGQKDKVPLQSELNLIYKYFDLHLARGEKKVVLDIGCSDNIDYQIVPVSLQILVENALKHNIASRKDPLYISISCEGPCVVVRNNLQKKATQLKSTGIGLKNLSERIRLITGKDLIIEETDSYYMVKIPLIK